MPSSGTVKVNGYNISKMKNKDVPYLRRSLGIVFQDYRLLPNKTVYENVAFAMRVIEAPRRLIQRSVISVLDVVGLKEKYRCFPSQLSGEENNSAWLSLELLSISRSIVIADEPIRQILTAETTWGIMEIFHRINQSGTTIVMATHNKDIVDTMQRPCYSDF